MAAPASASVEVIWEIGEDNDSRSEFALIGSIITSYTVGSPFNLFPGVLDIGNSLGPISVEIEFETAVPYINMSLLYGRMGGETNEVWLGETSLGTCYYADDPHGSEDYLFPVAGVVPGGEHTIKIECLGNVDYESADGAHAIDYLKLTGDPVEPTVETEITDGDLIVDVGEIATWDITIKICPDDVVNLEDVVVQGGIGADLAITAVNGGAVGFPMTKKTEQTVSVTDGNEVTLFKKGGKMGATIVRWDIGTLVSNGCLYLELTVQTWFNPKDKQEFTSEGTHELDGGFSATYWYEGKEYETPETDPLPVEVLPLPTP
jgi:hypothetical protein